jgi:hypothetical protein
MNDERLGMATGALLRDHDQPATDPRRSIGLVMDQVRVTPQGSRARWWFPLRRETIAARGPQAAGSHGQTTHVTTSRTQRPARAQAGGSRTMFGATKLFVAGVSVALVTVFVASGALRLSGPEVPGSAAPTSPGATSIGWTTEHVALAADDFQLEVNDLVFGEDVWPQSLDSNPGVDRWTLEVVWYEHDLEQRLNMYFESDGSDWWVREVRTYDGHEPGEWVFAYGPFFTTPLGEVFEGDVTVELLGEGRPDDPDAVIPAVLSFSGMRLAVSPGAGPTPDPIVVVEESPPAVDDTRGSADASTDPLDELCPDEEYPTAEDATLCQALVAAIGDPQAGGRCLSVEEAHDVAGAVLADLGLTQWAIYTAAGIDRDGCATATISPDDQRIIVLTGMHPEVRGVLDAFFELSLDECFDEATAVDTLTASLNEAGRTDFVIRVDSMLGGPSDRMEEIQAHADAGCVFYVGSGAEADGTPVYYLHGG